MSVTEQQVDGRPWSQAIMYWLEYQVAIAFHSDTNLGKSKQAVLDDLHLDALNQFLNARGFNLQSLNPDDVPQPLEGPSTNSKSISTKGIGGNPADTQADNDLYHLRGKYFFPSPSDAGTIVVCFFNVSTVKIPHPMQDPVALYGRVGIHDFDASLMRRIVNLINNNLEKLRRQGGIPVVAAMPNWLSSASPCQHVNGCYIPQPFRKGKGKIENKPITGEQPASDSWRINLPDIGDASPIRDAKGNDVTVFVLDTMPKIDHNQISSDDIGNELLKEIATQMDRSESPSVKFDYQVLPGHLAEDAPDTIKTGRDIYGRLFGFSMPDHGLFVTGIVRDLAPAANIECIRVLNDFGVGDVQTLLAALNSIQERRAKGGDLYNKPVVINLSLMVTPFGSKLADLWFGNNFIKADELTEATNDMQKLRLPLHLVIQSLVASGIVIVAASGNDSNTPETPQRIGPDYPAAFPEVISVGAVVGDGGVASYSNYPQLPPNHNGVATYGGTLPGPDADADADSLRGLYISPTFPPYSMDDPSGPENLPSNNCWAKWSGTSMATPIISAVAARVLEKVLQSNLPSHLWATQVQWAITSTEGQSEVLTGDAPLNPQPEFGVGLLRAVQGGSA